LIVQFPEKTKMVEMLIPLVAEEWSHFERVMEELKKRGWSLGPKRKDEYVDRLGKLIRSGGDRDFQVVERLLMSALIEARSCERFRLLWKEIKHAELSQFYYELMVSEAGHYKNFLAMAKEYMDEKEVMARWRELLDQEAEIVKTLEVRGDRMH